MPHPSHSSNRLICYDCYRPKSSCICQYITPIETKTRFVILMHPKEFRKTKNGTGHFTNLSLKNCSLHVGIDFSNNQTIQTLLTNTQNQCYVLYPSKTSINLNRASLQKENQQTILFLIDATWPCSKSILRQNPSLNALPKVSFTHTKTSHFQFKKQPQAYCLSTIESTLCVLELLNQNQEEHIEINSLKNFLRPFKKMVEYQMGFV